jgi:pimeloyl-ACP methyl ester carboxylesterase
MWHRNVARLEMPMHLRRVSRREFVASVLVLGVLGAALSWQWYGPRRVTVTAGKFPEELVYVRSSDDIINGGAIFAAPKALAKPIAVLWVHGWGANFYSPTYVMVGRALAERGFTAITVNTRMHDIGTNAGERGGKRVRGGGYWGVTSEDARDLAAWIDFAEERGFEKVVLVGHSAAWASVAAYQAERQDPRVVGMVLASGSVTPPPPPPNADLLAQATRLVADGKGDDLLRLPGRSFPSFVSAATFLDIAKTPPELSDFFGLQTQNAGITHIRCPLLAFYGTRGDVGGEAELERIKSSIKRQPSGPSRVDTVMIQRGDHMYTGEEAQVAQAIAEWADRLSIPDPSNGGVPSKP